MTINEQYLRQIKTDLDSAVSILQLTGQADKADLLNLKARVETVQAVIHEYPDLREQFRPIRQQFETLQQIQHVEITEEKENRDLIVAPINQYTGRRGKDASVCTSCAAAFIRNVLKGKDLSIATLQESIQQGQVAHERAAAKVQRGVDQNLAAADVLAHGNLNLKATASHSSRPRSAHTQRTHYLEMIRTLQAGKAAILTKAPYSAAIVFREGRYIYFDSHGEAETGNRAFIRTFRSADGFSQYLTNKFKFDGQFPDVDYDIYTSQDNPNLYELTTVELAQSSCTQKAIIPILAATAIVALSILMKLV